MPKRYFLSLIIGAFTCLYAFPQSNGMSFQEADKSGISIDELDSLYQSAIHNDTLLAVFKTEIEQEKIANEYFNLLNELAVFLSKNNFIWEKPTRCFNRVYFDKNGKIDYFLYNFLGKPEEKPTENQLIEFKRLLNLFCQNYTFPVSASVKFVQCGPSHYMPKK
jgi:hypothetical protein